MIKITDIKNDHLQLDTKIVKYDEKAIKLTNSWKDLVTKLIKLKESLKKYPIQLKLVNEAFDIYMNIFKTPIDFNKCREDSNLAFNKIILINDQIEIESIMDKLYFKTGISGNFSDLCKNYVDCNYSALLFSLGLTLI